MLKIGNIQIGGNKPCFIIAEIGQNHQGDIEIAKKMIQVAKECGVSCVKFQKTCLNERFTKSALEAPYTSENAFGATYGEHRAHLEFSEEEFKILKDFAEQSVGVMFASSCMDISSASFLKSIGVPFLKIGSGDTNNPILIEHVAKLGIPIILSTGMADLDTVDVAHNTIKKHHSNFAMLHCVSSYPTPPQDVNLSVMQLYKSRFPGIPIGYSGHEKGIAVAIAAVALGAKIIEKHFTLDKTMKGTDHPCSLDPTELKQLVQGIREVEVAIGIPVKKFLPSENPCSVKLGKTIVAAKPIAKDKEIQLSDIAIKVSNPPGIHPKYINYVIGKMLNKNVDQDVPITENDMAGSDFIQIYV